MGLTTANHASGHTRNHPAKLITFPPETLRRLDERVAAARAAGRAASRSGEVARCVAEADGNLARARHDVRQPLQTMRLLLAELSRRMRSPEDAASLQGLEWCVGEVGRLLAGPKGGTTGR